MLSLTRDNSRHNHCTPSASMETITIQGNQEPLKVYLVTQSNTQNSDLALGISINYQGIYPYDSFQSIRIQRKFIQQDTQTLEQKTVPMKQIQLTKVPQYNGPSENNPCITGLGEYMYSLNLNFENLDPIWILDSKKNDLTNPWTLQYQVDMLREHQNRKENIQLSIITQSDESSHLQYKPYLYPWLKEKATLIYLAFLTSFTKTGGLN